MTLGHEGISHSVFCVSMYNSQTLLDIYVYVIVYTTENHDRLISEELHFRPLGAVDCNITYHFNKRGHKYEAATWLGQVWEGSAHRPGVHQWKQTY